MTTTRPRKLHGLTEQQEEGLRVACSGTKTRPTFVGRLTLEPLKSGESRPSRATNPATGEPIRMIEGPRAGVVSYRVAASLVDLGLATYEDGRSRIVATANGKSRLRLFEKS